MDIAAISMQMSNTQLQMSVGVSVAKKTMDQQEIAAAGLINMLKTAAPPTDHLIDIKV